MSEIVKELTGIGILERLALESSIKSRDVEEMGQYLSRCLDDDGPSPELLTGMMRWRDYYRIAAGRGNEKLAKQMLLVSLPARKNSDRRG